ncbi:MAG: GWxTD domain-containing protein [bacterium]|nr:GWxTD domain-containing protein [bacterium]
MKRTLSIAVITVFLVGLSAVGFQQPLQAKKKKKGRDTFYEKARFIMTKEEKDIYKHLEGPEDRNLFVQEFWKKRDPDPSTDENENQAEFAKRIAYANKWFKENTKGNGWSTERGRLLLQLGFPDRREFGDAPVTIGGRLVTSKRIPMERWFYYRYQLFLEFTDSSDSGHLTLNRVPANLLTTLDLTRFSLDLRESYNVTKRAFRFNAKYDKKNDNITITIPTKKLSFDEKDGKMNVGFNAVVYVYRNSKKVDEFKLAKSFNWEKEKLLNMKKVKFDIPYSVTQKGKYYFDVVVEEVGSSSKFRDFVKYKM